MTSHEERGSSLNPNLASLLQDSAEKFPERIGIRLDDIALNYATMNQMSQRVSGLLKSKGIEKGDRVCVMLPNVPHFPMVYYLSLIHI